MVLFIGKRQRRDFGFCFCFLSAAPRLFFHLRAERSGWTLREASDALQSRCFCAKELRLRCDSSGGEEEEEEVAEEVEEEEEPTSPPPETQTEEEVGVI